MLLIETYLAASPIEGVGVFAAEFIPAGSLIYRFEPSFDRVIRQADLLKAGPSVRSFIDRYTYPHPTEKDCLILDADNGRHMNHAAVPNTDFRHAVFGYAIRDIAPGEEITCDYAEFEPGFVMLPSQTAIHGGLSKANGHGSPAP